MFLLRWIMSPFCKRPVVASNESPFGVVVLSPNQVEGVVTSRGELEIGSAVSGGEFTYTNACQICLEGGRGEGFFLPQERWALLDGVTTLNGMRVRITYVYEPRFQKRLITHLEVVN